MTSANDKQVAGSHYQSEFQHWDLITDHHIPYLEGCATKYLTRARKKNGRVDLEKALHYVEKLSEKAFSGGRYPFGLRRFSADTLMRFAEANQLEAIEIQALDVVCNWQTISDLEVAKSLIREMITACPTAPVE